LIGGPTEKSSAVAWEKSELSEEDYFFRQFGVEVSLMRIYWSFTQKTKFCGVSYVLKMEKGKEKLNQSRAEQAKRNRRNIE
jgi:hypothetical protein